MASPRAVLSVATGLSPVVELRRYRLHPGRRDELLHLFEQHLIAGQVEVGIDLVGHFADLDDPDRFVWLRGFADMVQRERALRDFYEGPVWRRHRDAANATMRAWDDVFLLRPARPGAAFAAEPAAGGEEGVVEVTTVFVEPSEEEATVDLFESLVAPPLAVCGVAILGYFVSEPSPNTFPRLPVRGERVFVSCLGFPDEPTYHALRGRPEVAARWTTLVGGQRRTPEVRRLRPLGTSLLTGGSPPCAAAAAPIVSR